MKLFLYNYSLECKFKNRSLIWEIQLFVKTNDTASIRIKYMLQKRMSLHDCRQGKSLLVTVQKKCTFQSLSHQHADVKFFFQVQKKFLNLHSKTALHFPKEPKKLGLVLNSYVEIANSHWSRPAYRPMCVLLRHPLKTAAVTFCLAATVKILVVKKCGSLYKICEAPNIFLTK